MTLKSILNDGIASLNKNKIDNAEFDAREILLNLLDMDLATFLFCEDDDLEEKHNTHYISEIINNFDRLISYRSQHFPLQYILGETYFCGIKFNIREGVLIPRFDTEVLVEKVINDNQDKNKYVLDMCTGSGCIALSLAKLGGYKIVACSDISVDALELASENADMIIENNDVYDEMNQKVYFIQSDMFDNFDKFRENTGIDKFDIITINPPYIKTDDLNNLQIEVKQFEPKIALDGDIDGLKYYKKIAESAKDYMNVDGKIYLEIGFDQAKDVMQIFEKTGYKFVELVKDLSGNDRVLIFTNNI